MTDWKVKSELLRHIQHALQRSRELQVVWVHRSPVITSDFVAGHFSTVISSSIVPITFSPRPHNSAWILPLSCAALVLATLAAYHNSFSGPFVYDDISAIKDNPTIRQLWPISTVLSPPSNSGVTVSGRPLVNLSLAINYALGGTKVEGYHTLNLAIHLFAGLALFGIIRRTLNLPSLCGRFEPDGTRTLLAGTTALLWMLHPLQTESVTYVIQRAESLVGLFYLLTFYCFLRSVAAGSRGCWQVLTVLACLLGMACKEVMASAPLLVLFFDRAVVSGSFLAAWQRHSRLYLGLGGTWILLAWLVAGTGGRGGTAGFGAGGISSWHYALTSAGAIGQYLKLTFWPDTLIFDYGTAVEKQLLPVLPESLLIVSLLIMTAYFLWRRPLLGFLGLWFFAILGPSSSIIPITTETIAEHRMYLPLAAIITLVVIGLSQLVGRKAPILLLALALGAGWRTSIRNEDYNEEIRLWQGSLVKYPANARAHNSVGEILYRQGKFPEAGACFREALRFFPNYTDALNNLGKSLAQQGGATEALPYFAAALRLQPDDADTLNNIGNVLFQLGQKEEAIPNYRKAIRIKPTFAEAHNNLGVALAAQGHYEEAIDHYVTALRLDPTFLDAHCNYGIALRLSGKITEAQQQFGEVLKHKPTHWVAHSNLGIILSQQGKLANARNHFEAVLRSKSDDPDAQCNLGIVIYRLGQPREALPYFEAAVRLNPDHVAARINLSDMLNILGTEALVASDLPTARIRFANAITAYPSNSDAHHNLGVVLWRQGALTAALLHFETAVKLKPDFTEARKAVAELRLQLARAISKP